MEFLGTKGKFKVVEVERGIAKGYYLSGDNQRCFIAQIITDDRKEKENLANATLFSKAPEMLEMLRRVYNETSYQSHLFPEILQLIAEATELN